MNGAEERDGPPVVPQDRYASDGVLQQPFIVRRKEQNSPAPRVVDKEQTYSNELMLDPSVPPPAWCANFSVIDDSASVEVEVTPERPEASPVSDTSEALFTDSLGQKPSTTPTKHQRSASFDFGSGSALPSAQQYPNLMSTASEDAAARQTSPPNLRRSRSVECFGSVSKRGSASPVRSRPSPEMGMLPPRRAPSPEMGMRPPRRANAPGSTGPGTPLRGRSPLRSASPLRGASPLRRASPKPEATSRRNCTPHASPVPNRGRASPKPPRPHGQSVLGSLVGGGDNKRPPKEPSSASPKPPVLPSLDKQEGSATKAKPTATVTTRDNATAASSKASPFFVLDRAVITIQSAIRGHQARQEALIRMGSVLMIQSVIRRHLAVVECFSRRGSIVSIQAWYRGELVRKELEYLQWCAIQIQSSWRQHVARQDFASTKSKLIVAQSVWRGHIAQKNYRMSKERVTKIQALARQRAAEENLQKSRNAAISIQASVRAAAAKNHFDASRAAVSTIQASFRGAACRKKYEKTVSSAIRIQALARTSSVRAKYIATIQAVVRLQALAREVEAKKRYQSIIAGVIKMQAIAMRIAAQQRYDATRRVAIVSQSFARRIAAQRRYDATRRVAIVSQSFARQMKARRSYLSAVKAIVLMQSAVRMASDRKQYSVVCLSVIRMQACIRRAIAERKAAQLREEARVVAQENHAAVVVQSYWRRFVAKEEFAESVVSVSLIQMYWRRYQAICTVERLKAERERRLQIELEERRNNAATLIQSTWRGYYHEMAYVDAIIAATIIQAYTRRYKSQCSYAKLLQLHKEEQAREQQRAAEREALRRSEMAAQRRKLEQERLEAERLKREERERAEKQRLAAERLRREERERKEQERLEAERLVQEERERNEQKLLQAEREERAREEAERIRADEKEQQTLEADIVAEFKETRTEENKAESRRVQETERSAVRPSEGPMSPPKRSVIAAGASPSIKDRIRMFSGGGGSAAAASPSPVPLGRSAAPYQKPTFRSPSSVAAAKKTPVVATSTNTPASPKSPLQCQQGNSSDKAPIVHKSPVKVVKESSSPVPVRTVAAKESPSHVPMRTFVQSPTKAEISPASKRVSPRKAQPNASGGSSFDFNQIKNRFDTGKKSAVTEPALGHDNVQKPPNHRSPGFQRSLKTKVVEWEVSQTPSAKQVETEVGDRAEVAVAESEFGQSPKQKDFNQIKNRFDKKSAVTESAPGHDNVQKPPEFVAVAKSKFGQSPRQQTELPVKQSTPVSQAIHDNDGWEDFGSIPSFRKTFGGTSPSWKKTQPQSRTEVDSCPDDVLNSFKQIQASAAAKSPAKVAWKPPANASPATRSSPKVNRGEPIIPRQAPPKSPSNAFKLRPCRRDTPTLDHNLPNPLSPPRTRSGKSYQGDNSRRREMRMNRN